MLRRIYENVNMFMEECRDDKINACAAQTAFFIILSAIPFLMVFTSLIQYTAVTEEIVIEIIRRLMPEYVSPFLISVVDEVYSRSGGIISVTAVLAVWSASKGVHYMADGLNSVHDLKETRNWFVLRLWSLIYTIIFLVAIVLALVVLVFGNSLIDIAIVHIPVLTKVLQMVSYFKGIVMFVLLVFFFAVVFKTLPNQKLTLRSQLPGAIICSMAWYLLSFAVSIYVDYFNGFSMYGSLTTIAMIMLWLYFCIYIMLLSAEVNVVYERHFQKLRERVENKK